MTDYFDALETRDPAERDAAQLAVLVAQIAHAQGNCPFYTDHLAGFDAEAVKSRDDLAELPVTRKADLLHRQQAIPPFGGLTATETKDLQRVFLSPGPIADPEGFGEDWWRMGRAVFAAGFRRGDIALNCFSYHHTPAGHMFESGARAVGCAVYPGGVGQTEAQVQAIGHFRTGGYVGTPDFLKNILEKADALGADVRCLKRALVSGGALFPSLRAEYSDRGIHTLQCYGTADLGLIAYESDAQEGMILDEGVIVEIVRPGTGDPVADGEVGEVVVTLLHNKDYPLIRFATGDLSAILPGQSPCGRTNRRIRGWMGRADQRTKIKGMFVDPTQIDRVVKAHPDLVRARLDVTFVDNRDRMVLICESEVFSDDFRDRVAETLRTETKLRGEVKLEPPGSLPNDGKIIDDRRKYE